MSTETTNLTPPESLQGRAREWWVEMVETFEGFDAEPHSRELLTRAALQLMRAEAARECLEDRGLWVTDRFGQLRENPLAITERAAVNSFRLLVRELGIVETSPEDTRIARLKGYR